MNKAVGIIPARYASTRFPGKPLGLIGNKPMIQHVYERASHAKSLDKVIVATDDERIMQAVKSFDGDVFLTRTDHQTGSDRIAEVAENLDFAIIVNIQGDEPFVDPDAIDQTVELLQNSPDAAISTLVAPIRNSSDLHNPDVAKVVLNNNHEALYFSRAAIPYNRDEKNPGKWLEYGNYYQHIGFYVYRKEILMQFVKWPLGTLEKRESLEQLRLLENGYKIVCAEVPQTAMCVDTPEDLEKAQQYWEEQQLV
ncbi:MAG: 3-deoxy-manno-octulosonate cytidylyltransferase [Calditrichaeota bacterium]|nr:MAG: 3-deoxy-manno-octulosonate cytidylyltransferase [Calditrichota bacterium]